MRELRKELEALAMVLQNLLRLLDNSGAGFPELDSPLKGCARTCQELQALIIGCSSTSGGTLAIAWDWSKLQFKGAEIAAMKDNLAIYKATINLALGGANLRVVNTTAKVVQELKALAIETKQELQEQLLGFETKLQTFGTPSGSTSNEDAAEREYIQEKMESTQKCLAVLAQISAHIEQHWRNSSKDLFAADKSRYTQAVTLGDLLSGPRAISNGVRLCRGTLSEVACELEDHLQQMDNRMQSLSVRRDMTEGGDDPGRQRTQEDWDNINKCINICDEAVEQASLPQTNVFEDISTGPNSFQAIVTTLEDLISARRVTAETGATQILGKASDASIQQISRDRACVAGSNQAREERNRGGKNSEGTPRERSVGKVKSRMEMVAEENAVNGEDSGEGRDRVRVPARAEP